MQEPVNLLLEINNKSGQCFGKWPLLVNSKVFTHTQT